MVTQEALDLGRQGVGAARRQRPLLGLRSARTGIRGRTGRFEVLGVLQLGHIGGRVLVVGHPLAHLALVGDGGFPQGRRVDRGAEQLSRAFDQRQGRFRRRHLVDVVGHRGPQRRRGQVRLAQGVHEDADDPGRALVGRGREAGSAGQVPVAAGAGDSHRAGVRDVREQRPEHHRQLGAHGLDDRDDRLAKRPPPQLGLDPAQKQHVMGAGRAPRAASTSMHGHSSRRPPPAVGRTVGRVTVKS